MQDPSRCVRGHSRRSNEAIIGTREGVVRAYAVKRMDEERRWDAKYLQEMKETPQQPDRSRPGLAIPIKVNIDPPHEESPAPAEGPVDECDRQVRRMRITGVMLQKYGYTEGCDGCRYKRAGMREARPHTEVCRRRIEEAMMGDETDRRKKEEDDERVNWRLAEKMEKILKEKQETVETIEKEPEDVIFEQEPEEDCRVGKRPMEKQEEGPERKRMQVSVKDALAQWGRKRSAGGKTRTAGDQGGAGREQETERECTRRGVGGVAHGPFFDPAAPARERGRGRALQSTPGDR